VSTTLGATSGALVAPTGGVSEFDLNLPPLDPPAECVDVVMWRRAYALFNEHPAGPGGCSRCGGSYPCLANRLARAGLLTAVGLFNDDSNFWTEYARLLAFQPVTERRPPARDGRP
jgi:hypothetical protein